MGKEGPQEYYFTFDRSHRKDEPPVVEKQECDPEDEPLVAEKQDCDPEDELRVAEEQEYDPEEEPSVAEEQECCPEVEPWIVAEMGPVPEELGCGPMEEQWIAAEMGCISQERGAWKILEQSCMEEAKVEPKEEEFKYEISRCDARLHPNICRLEQPGPNAVLEPSSILAVTNVGEISSRLVKLQNVGTTCLFYSWERISKESIVDKNKALGMCPVCRSSVG